MSNFTRRVVLDDVNKSIIKQCIKYKPDFIIFDFIDERFNLLQSKDKKHYITYSNYFKQSLLYKQYSSSYDMLSWKEKPDYMMDLWQQSAKTIANTIAKVLRNTRLILHKAYYAECYQDVNGKCHNYTNLSEIEVNNKHLHNMYNYFTNITNCDIVCADPSKCVGNLNHKWGLAPFHYIDDYYIDIAKELKKNDCLKSI